MTVTTRIDARFKALAAEGRAGLVTLITGGDPDYDASLEILKALPKAGADIIEVGVPFTDAMADGPPIQASSLRALAAGQSLEKTIAMVRAFRKDDNEIEGRRKACPGCNATANPRHLRFADQRVLCSTTSPKQEDIEQLLCDAKEGTEKRVLGISGNVPNYRKCRTKKRARSAAAS